MTSNASGVSAILAAPMSTIQTSFWMSGYCAPISSKTLWNRPSVIFMMLSFRSERIRRVGHLGGADVHDPDLLLDVRVLRADFVENLVEQAVGHLHDVVLHEAGDLLAIVAARVLERVAHDLFAARPRNELDAGHHFGAHPVLDPGVQVLFVLPDDHHIHIGVLGVDEGVVRDARPHVGILAQRLARGHVEALEAAALGRGDRSLQEDLGSQQRFPGARLDTCAIAAQVDLLGKMASSMASVATSTASGAASALQGIEQWLLQTAYLAIIAVTAVGKSIPIVGTLFEHGGVVPSAAGGMITGGGGLSILHPREAVLPSRLTNFLLDAAGQGGGGA